MFCNRHYNSTSHSLDRFVWNVNHIVLWLGEALDFLLQTVWFDKQSYTHVDLCNESLLFLIKKKIMKNKKQYSVSIGKEKRKKRKKESTSLSFLVN